jgi:D-serine deaminase-like pyridoxal phosphate-dependent protein
VTADGLQALLDEPLGVRHKAFPPSLAGVRVRDVGAQRLNVARGDLLLPALVLREEALAHNLATMAAWCERHGVSLAPHGKTTMAPQLLHRQLDAGCWAITAASTHQAAIMRAHGLRRVLIANEVIDPAALRWIAGVLEDDPSFELLCLVDSTDGVALMDRALARAGARVRLSVLIELGSPGRRAGLRDDDEADAVAAAVRASARLRLAGVECFEGVIGPGREPAAIAEVDRLLARVHGLAARLDADGAFADAQEILLTAGGSVFFDRVAQLRAHGELSRPTRVVLRSGCYVTHDAGVYDSLSPLGSVFGADGGPRLHPALELWSVVLSRPEPELAILGFGRREAPFDAGLPQPLRILGADGAARPLGDGVELLALNDQHAIARVPAALALRVGERVVCGISHPCTAFDKWSLLPLVDARDDVIGAVRTLF